MSTKNSGARTWVISETQVVRNPGSGRTEYRNWRPGKMSAGTSERTRNPRPGGVMWGRFPGEEKKFQAASWEIGRVWVRVSTEMWGIGISCEPTYQTRPGSHGREFDHRARMDGFPTAALWERNGGAPGYPLPE